MRLQAGTSEISHDLNPVEVKSQDNVFHHTRSAFNLVSATVMQRKPVDLVHFLF